MLSASLSETLPLTEFAAVQGITIGPDYAYSQAQVFNPSTLSNDSQIYRLNKTTFGLLATATITRSTPIWSGVSDHSCHAGSSAINPADGYLYVTFMSPELGRSALLKLHPTTLALIAAIDTTAYGQYMDAIAFDDSGRLWLNDEAPSTTPLGFAAVNWASFVIDSGGIPILNPTSAAWEKARYLYDRARWGTPQGLRVRNGYVYAVPENDPSEIPPHTAAADNGIIVFKVATLVDAETSIVSPLNTPHVFYPFQLPSPGNADHESFDFSATDPNYIWISASEGTSLYRLQLQPIP